jgi:hypothetical protein
VDASQGGAFGLDTRANDDNSRADDDDGFNFAVVDDVTNSLMVVRLPRGH